MHRNEILSECWDKALYALATARVFSLRAQQKDIWLKINTCLGILLPSFVGGVVLTYGEAAKNLPLIIFIAGLLGILQLMLSVISVALAWQESKNYYIESSISNRNLYESFKNIAQFPSNDDKILKEDYDKLEVQERLRNDFDDKYPFSLKEERKGMRYALRHFKRECASCKTVPTSMKASNCDTCGNFN